MTDMNQFTGPTSRQRDFEGARGRITVQEWPNRHARYVALLSHGAGEPLGSLPTLWIHGADDALVPADSSGLGVEKLGARTLERHVYPGARHEVFNETNRDEVITDVITFIDRALGKA